jgi:hypothetical protein
MLTKTIALAAAFAVMSVATAQAALTISNRPTRNVACSAGSCAATKNYANLNISDLVTMLATSDVSVSAIPRSFQMSIMNPVSWSSPHGLSLDSRGPLTILAPVVSEGGGAVHLWPSRDVGNTSPAFSPNGKIVFWDLSSAFTVGFTAYTLESSIQTLASDIQSNPSGHYVLVNDYDAAGDGIYQTSPISTTFTGRFTGNGNTIRNLTIYGPGSNAALGLFACICGSGSVGNLHLLKIHVKGKSGSTVGGLAGNLNGTVEDVSVAGTIAAGPNSSVGGLIGSVPLLGFVVESRVSGAVFGMGTDTTGSSAVGGLIGSVPDYQAGPVETSSSASVTGGAGWRAGGLIGATTGDVKWSFATGTVIAGDNGIAGGLIGESLGGHITETYATGFTEGGVNSVVGGLIGHNQGPVSASYSSGGVASGSGNAVGGLIGNDSGASDLTNTYWDTTTSGQSHGVGNDTSYPGVTGLTTEQFQAGLPAGFFPSTWAENADINGGLPYLLFWPPN